VTRAPSIVNFSKQLRLYFRGRLRPVRQDEDDFMDSDETTQVKAAETETHKITMERKEALTKWLEKVTGDGLAKDLQNARSSEDHLDEILGQFFSSNHYLHCQFSGFLFIPSPVIFLVKKMQHIFFREIAMFISRLLSFDEFFQHVLDY
jgi:hypothetical protein